MVAEPSVVVVFPWRWADQADVQFCLVALLEFG